MKEKTYTQTPNTAAGFEKIGAFLLILILGIPIFLIGMVFGMISKKSEPNKPESIE